MTTIHPISTSQRDKKSHAVLDIESRRRKAALITELVEHNVGPLSAMDVLEIGTGSGYISAIIAPGCRSFVSVDIVDERKDHSFKFQTVSSETLPFPESKFDLVISNHVIEHVDDQRAHLREASRVLRADGAVYLSTPNRYTLNEPHFRLPFLSWLPMRMRDSYVRLAKKGDRFDVQPLSRRDLRILAESAKFAVRDIGDQMTARRLAEKLPVPRLMVRAAWPGLRVLAPTFVTILRSNESDDGLERPAT